MVISHKTKAGHGTVQSQVHAHVTMAIETESDGVMITMDTDEREER